MKKTVLFIALSLIIIISITSITAVSSAQDAPENTNVVIENETLNADDKSIIEQFYNDKSISAKDREEIKDLFDVPQLFNASSKTDSQDESLKNNIDSYNTIVKYLQTVIEENSMESYICLGVDGYTKEDIILSFASKDGELLEMNEEVANALAIIKEAFSALGYKLDTIRIKDGYISFDTIDGQYSLVYALDETININSISHGDSNSNFKKAQDNWYHKISK